MKKLLLLSIILFFLINTSRAQYIDLDIIYFGTSSNLETIRASDFPVTLQSNQSILQDIGIDIQYENNDDVSTTIKMYVSDGTTNTLLQEFSFMNNGQHHMSLPLQSKKNLNYVLDYTKSYKLFVTATYNSTNGETTISEAITFKVEEAYNQIYNNIICCDQTTFSYPFDPIQVNQSISNSITTKDGANIASFQWQRLSGTNWGNISGATQLSYDPPSINADTKYRRIIKSSSGAISNSEPISIIKTNEIISGNFICCSQTSAVMPFDPAILTQKNNTTITSNIGSGITFAYQWQDSTNGVWNNIAGATNIFYDPSWIKNPTGFRRVAISSSGFQNVSNTVSIILQSCNRPTAQQNIICGNQAFYKLQNGDIIHPGKILGAFISPNIDRREFGYDYMISIDGNNWFNFKAKHLISTHVYDGSGTYYICNDLGSPYSSFGYDDLEQCAILKNELDFQMSPYIFDINKGSIQHIYIRRDYYHWYDDYSCGIWGIPKPCKASWHFESSSNIATITLTTADLPKPVAPITSSRDNVTCKWNEQTINFSVSQLNNQEYYKWEIPASWSSYSALEGPYANQISVNANSASKNFATGGQVCLTVTQGAQSDRQCKTITGTAQFYSFIPTPPINACEGQIVILKPMLYGADTNPDHYTFNWAAPQSIIDCNPPGSDFTNCKELKVTIGNVRQNPKQEVLLTTVNAFGCIYTSKSSLITTPGLQMGILNTYDDPMAISNSGLAVNPSSNNLFFTEKAKNIYRSYYDNTIGQQIWKYTAVRDKTNNKTIRSEGPVAYYNGSTDKLFYVFGTNTNTNLYFAESTDNGLTWVDKLSSGAIAVYIDPRIKVYGNNIYYIENVTRKVFYRDISVSNASAVLVGNIPVNYSDRMFAVEDGILAYADQSNNIVAFNALTGVSLTINVPAHIKQVNYNSSISTYNGNIYYTSSSGALRILKKNTATGIYNNYEEVNNLQLAGPFAINKQTGTLYAKAYDVLGKQIYYLNNKWNTAPIDNILSISPIQSDMIYSNGHAYYIGDRGYLSNTYYIAPCIPQVLRTANNHLNEAGDFVNEPLSNTITEDHSVIVYPNPTSGVSKITLTIPQKSIVQIKIIPITGGSTDIKYNAVTESGTQDLSLDLSTYAAGIYLVQVYVDGSLYANSKLIKQ